MAKADSSLMNKEQKGAPQAAEAPFPNGLPVWVALVA